MPFSHIRFATPENLSHEVGRTFAILDDLSGCVARELPKCSIISAFLASSQARLMMHFRHIEDVFPASIHHAHDSSPGCWKSCPKY